MDFRFFLAFSLCFLCSFPLLTCSANRLPKLLITSTITKKSAVRTKTDGFYIKIDPTRVIQLSSQPRMKIDRAFLYKGFLSEEQCHHIINLARDKLEKSMVTDDETGESLLSEDRTSTGTFLDLAQDDIVAAIESKIAAWTFLPINHGEPMQVLRYENGQKYEPHYDYFLDPVNIAFGGHRIATVLMYLSDVVKGGETVFPGSRVKLPEAQKNNLSDCAKIGYGVKPKKGDALLFFSLHANMTPDTTSYHGSCPVIEGEKWSVTKWIHMLPYTEIWRNPDCVDENEHCSSWANAGECETNPNYMVGTKGVLGYCRKSCKVCSSSS